MNVAREAGKLRHVFLKDKAKDGDRSSGKVPEDVDSRGGMSLRRLVATIKGMQAAGRVAAAVEPRDQVFEVVARGPAMFM